MILDENGHKARIEYITQTTGRVYLDGVELKNVLSCSTNDDVQDELLTMTVKIRLSGLEIEKVTKKVEIFDEKGMPTGTFAEVTK